MTVGEGRCVIMIKSLHIENIAVVRSLDIDFDSGFSVLTGETGAGKSIIIDSLKLLLGSRFDRELIRSGESCAAVCAVFGNINAESASLIAEMGFDAPDGEIMISRTLTVAPGGNDVRSIARLNGRTVTLAVLKEVSATLFSIHGQNENQRFLSSSAHIGLLDSFAGLRSGLEKYRKLYKRILALREETDSIRRDSREQNRLCEMLRYQVSDIDSAKLRPGEDEKLEAMAKRLGGLEKISKCCALVDRALMGGEKGNGAVYLTERAGAALLQIADSLPEAEELSRRLTELKYELADVAECVSALSDTGEDNPEAALDRIEARLDVIAKLKRKYGSTVDEILSFRAETAARLEGIENSGERLEELEGELEQVSAEARSAAAELTRKRTEAANKLTHSVTEALSFLDMPKVRFSVDIKPAQDFGINGLDDVAFMISTNPGEPLTPLEKTASGGELSRIMLAMKSILNEADGIDTVVFDEVDTGISGKTSRKVGIKLRQTSKKSQVLCVTHSAQIASLADCHFFISKKEEKGRTVTSVQRLDDDGRVGEIARILGGIEITDAQKTAAQEMLSEREKY